MRWLLFFVMLLLMLGAAALGVWIGKKDDKTAGAVIFLGLLFVLLRVGLRFFPLFEFYALPFDWYAVARPWWSVPFAILILAAGARHMSTKNAQKLVGVFAATVFFVVLTRLWSTARFEPETMTGVVGSAGVCAQTTGYTCGASAAATLLHHYGIESTEREMADLCWTNSLSGTDEMCVARGLRRKLVGSGRSVEFRRADFEQLRAHPEPSMVTIKLTFFVDHWVVVYGVRDDDKVLVGDPIGNGRQLYSKEDFMAKWRGWMLTAELE